MSETFARGMRHSSWGQCSARNFTSPKMGARFVRLGTAWNVCLTKPHKPPNDEKQDSTFCKAYGPRRWCSDPASCVSRIPTLCSSPWRWSITHTLRSNVRCAFRCSSQLSGPFFSVFDFFLVLYERAPTAADRFGAIRSNATG